LNNNANNTDRMRDRPFSQFHLGTLNPQSRENTEIGSFLSREKLAAVA